ncbi:MAG: glutaredoxin 3 [Acetobacteraceae bacterium]|nr:glutaredoxin 3 [Acetobacteraceae bacterium]
MTEIDIYTQDWCGYCARAKQLLQRKGASYREINAPNGTPERAEAVARSGGRTTVPQIFIDGQHVGGCDELVALERTGRLDALLAGAA